MIIFKTIILYFIQIRQTDDFPSTGTRLVIIKRHLNQDVRNVHLQGLNSPTNLLSVFQITTPPNTSSYIKFVLEEITISQASVQ